ncbi:acyltransferase 3 [Liberibacter crescens BT-1]|uniref:Acyltransferase 3 n=1 Tax=Liberibacter crescens (strain BT-1) TaxID=1215343 RepID=L0EW69_LIBCB|nr:acyltransferase 3 [Liberibacter crescens BT-1]AMC12736.1 hypothetical protein RL73_03235 [Liberibacter crescens]
MLLITAFILGPFLTNYKIHHYFVNIIFIKYFFPLILKMYHSELPGVFIKNPFPKVVNGSIWTIPAEIYCYILVMVFGIFGFFKKRSRIFILLIFSIILHVVKPLSRTKWLIFEFIYGLFFFYNINLLTKKPIYVMLFFFISSAIFFKIGYQNLIFEMSLPPCILLLGIYKIPFFFRIKEYIGDLSYGVYIYGFPVQQTISSLYGSKISFSLNFLLSLLLTIVFSFLSYNYIEKPILKLKPSRKY